MMAGTLVSIIITIVSFMLSAGVLYAFTAQADDKQAELLCHDSVALRAKTMITPADNAVVKSEIKTVPFLCKTIDTKVSGTREELKQQIADKIARCWWMFGEGRYEELLQGSRISILPSVFGFEDSKNKCFNCYSLLVDEDTIEGGPILGSELVTYMKNTKYPKSSNVTYLEYVQSFGGPGRVAFSAPAIIPRQAYSVSMMPKNKEVGGSTFWKGAGQVALGAVVAIGVVGGAVCVIGTAGACAAVLAPVAAVVGESAALSGGIAASAAVTKIGIAGTVLVAGETTYTAYSGYKNIMSTMYGERDVSSVYVGFLQTGQEECGSGDIAGE